MTIKEIFDKATNETKSLTYAEFEALTKQEKAKFTDLAEGKYVDKQKYMDELASKDLELSSLNDTLAKRVSDISSLQEQLKSVGDDAGKLEELSVKLSDLQSKYETDTTALQDKLKSQAYQFAVRDFANSQNFSSAAAKRDFERSMIAKNLPMENGNIMGAKDYMKEYAKDNEDAFVKKHQNPAPDTKPHFSAQANGQGQSNTKMTLTELMQMKNENPDAVINFG